MGSLIIRNYMFYFTRECLFNWIIETNNANIIDTQLPRINGPIAHFRPKPEEKKHKPGQNNRSLSRISQNTASRPQSRNNTKTPLKRQNSLDLPVSPRQPLAQALAVAAPPPQQPIIAEQPQGEFLTLYFKYTIQKVTESNYSQQQFICH